MTNSSIISSLPMIKNIESNNFFVMAGPCVAESREILFSIAERCIEVTSRLEIPYIFKASYRKANRSRLDSFSGVGDIEALEMLAEVRERFHVPVVTDIHSADEAALAAQYVDILQIPAFLCRQTDLLVAAAKTGKVVNIKKGQFLSPDAMRHAAQKVVDSGNSNVLLTDRGTSFGYTDLLVDPRAIPIMKQSGFPVVMDITHSLQQPNQQSGVTGGMPEMIETIARTAVVNGVDGIFIETHPNPSEALSDGANMLNLEQFEGLMERLVKIRQLINRI